MGKVDGLKNWFFEQINDIDISLASIIRKEKIQTTNIRNERGNITTDSTDTKKTTKEYYKQLYANKFDNFDELKIFETQTTKAH